MSQLLAIVALAVVGGAVVVVASRDTRTVLLALAVTLVATPLVADPLAAPLGLAARLVGAILATYLLWVVARDRGVGATLASPTGGSRIGWPAEVLLAAGGGGRRVCGPWAGRPGRWTRRRERGRVRGRRAGRGAGRDRPRRHPRGDGAPAADRRRAPRPGVPSAARPATLEQLITAAMLIVLGGRGRGARGERPGRRIRRLRVLGSGAALARSSRARRPPARPAPDRRAPMSLLPFVLVTSVGAVLALLLRRNEGVATAIAIAGLLGAAVTALAIGPGQSVVVGGAGIATTEYLRLFLVLGAIVGLLLAVVGQAVGSRRDAPPSRSGCWRRRPWRCRCPTRGSRSSRPPPAGGSARS